MEPSGFNRRYFAFLLDIAVLEILGIFLTQAFWSQTGTDMGSMLLSLLPGRTREGQTLSILIGYGLLQALLVCAYFVVFTGINGQTPGKKLLGIQVRKAGGQPMDLTSAAFRVFPGYALSAVTLGLGFWLALVDPHRQALHDKVAKTRVFIV
jgi:uncharacterized RDD family membrane protein YckC